LKALSKLLFVSLFVLQNQSSFAGMSACPVATEEDSGVVVQIMQRVDSTDEEIAESDLHISTLLIETLAMNPNIQPVIRMIATNGKKLTRWLGEREIKFKRVMSVIRACGGGGVTAYLGVTLAGDGALLSQWQAKLAIVAVSAPISAVLMWRNANVQSFITFSPARKIATLLRRAGYRVKADLGRPGWILDRASEPVRSAIVELFSEGPKQEVAKRVLKDGFKGSLNLVGWLTLGQGFCEIALGKRTKEILKKVHDKIEAAGIQLLSDSAVLGLSLIAGSLAVHMEYVRVGGGIGILQTVAVMGILGWLDTFLSGPILRLSHSILQQVEELGLTSLSGALATATDSLQAGGGELALRTVAATGLLAVLGLFTGTQAPSNVAGAMSCAEDLIAQLTPLSPLSLQ
jgi:hypothetical protein